MQGIAPHKLGSQWNFLNFQSPSISAATISGISSPLYSGEKFSTLVVQTEKDRHASTESLVSLMETVEDKSTGYKVPLKAKVDSTWVSEEGKQMSLQVNLSLNHQEMHKVDILGELPWLVRKAIQLLVSKPFVYQFVETAELILKEDGVEILREEGTALFEVTYTNPN
jgi:hypothetical protein